MAFCASSRLRLVWAVLAAALTLSACASGSIEDVQRELEGAGSSAADDVKPPPEASSTLTGRVGVIVATNSESWAKLLDAPSDPGVAVLFVQPDGPADQAGLKRGDVITKVNGEQATNADRAVYLLRAEPDQDRSVDVVSSDGTSSVTITAKVPPPDLDLRSLYDPLISRNPNDPVLYFLRAQAGGLVDDSLADAQKAVDLDPGFVEAISLRAERLWDKSNDQEIEAAEAEELRDRAFTDWDLALRLDGDNTRVLVSRSQAQTLRGNAARATRDAERALELDDTFPRAYYALAVATAQLGRYGQAAAPARRAIDLDPFDVRYYRALAAVFMRLDRKDDATRTVDAIIDLIPDQPTKDSLTQVLQDGGSARP